MTVEEPIEPTAAERPTVDALIDDLRAGAETVERGEFTIDRAAAREKLRQYALERPEAYVLELVQVAVLLGATRIRITVDSDDLRLRCDGEPLEQRDFDERYESLFTGRGDDRRRRLRHKLALALDGALRLEPRFIRVRSLNPPGRVATLELRPGAPERSETAPADAEDLEGHLSTRIHVKLPRRAARIAGRLPELKLLRERCRYATADIVVNGRSVSGGVAVDSELDLTRPQPIEGDGLRGEAAFAQRSAAPAQTDIVVCGLLVTSVAGPGNVDGFRAVVEGDHLRQDLSQSDVVRDEAFTALMEAVDRARRAALRQLIAKKGAHRARGGAQSRRILQQACAELVPPPGSAGEPALRALRTTSIWPLLRRGGKKNGWQYTSLADLEREEGQVSWVVCPNPDQLPSRTRRHLRRECSGDLCVAVVDETVGLFVESALPGRAQPEEKLLAQASKAGRITVKDVGAWGLGTVVYLIFEFWWIFAIAAFVLIDIYC